MWHLYFYLFAQLDFLEIIYYTKLWFLTKNKYFFTNNSSLFCTPNICVLHFYTISSLILHTWLQAWPPLRLNHHIKAIDQDLQKNCRYFIVFLKTFSRFCKWWPGLALTFIFTLMKNWGLSPTTENRVQKKKIQTTAPKTKCSKKLEHRKYLSPKEWLLLIHP